MALISTAIAGVAPVASAYTSQYSSDDVLTNTVSQHNELIVNGLPSLFVYIRQTAGPNGCIFHPLFAIQNDAAGLPDWLPFNAGVVLSNVPVYFNIRASVAVLAAQITNNTGVTCTFDIVVAASS
jgi:hypothetical protein